MVGSYYIYTKLKPTVKPNQQIPKHKLSKLSKKKAPCTNNALTCITHVDKP